ncbi:MAG: hypothetical protein J0L84_08965, partial [Verrucomicrobia bacterium]|nr:hypothetical protein [Verrucomicrobiota bacterium]
MRRCSLALGILLAGGLLARAEVTYRDWDQPPHRYFERTPSDRFSRLRQALESGEAPLDRSN